MVDPTGRDAWELLRAARDIHAGGYGVAALEPGTPLALELAAQYMGISPGHPRYNAYVDRLEAEGVIELNPYTEDAMGSALYVLTRRGLEALRFG